MNQLLNNRKRLGNRVFFEECHSTGFSGHAGGDNIIRRIKQRFYWPDCYNDAVEIVSESLIFVHAFSNS